MKGSVLLLGPPGAGKTSSLRNVAKDKILNPKVYVINSERKDLPFPEKMKWESRPKNTKEILTTYDQLIAAGVAKGIIAVLQDSFSAFVELAAAEARALYSGYDIWKAYNASISELFIKQKDLVDASIHSFMIAHDEVVVDEGSALVKRSAKVKGKEWEGMVEKEFNIALWAEVVPDEKDTTGTKFKHRFMTNTNGKIPAKSPVDMFPRFIDNDLKLVIESIQNYGVEKPESQQV